MNERRFRDGPFYALVLTLVVVIVALVITLVGCDGGDGDPEPVKDTYPYPYGTVQDKTHDDRGYRLFIKYPPTNVGGWQPVHVDEYINCQRGETWRLSDPDGCP